MTQHEQSQAWETLQLLVTMGRVARMLPPELTVGVPTQTEFMTFIKFLEAAFDRGARQELVRINETDGGM